VHALEPAGIARDSRAPVSYTNWTFAAVRRADLPASGAKPDAGAPPRRAGDAGEAAVWADVCGSDEQVVWWGCGRAGGSGAESGNTWWCSTCGVACSESGF